ncbi:hypothetical protein [Streptomyces avidinii]|uniref:Uncharacterized protein n=1 Tax=Streptomyces avidinii TaxID=1895 RepID=A0ABS4L6Z8_STRAV|nr:hypothetical protein [Streptomyces avidinii]MBP2037848.1 hypothetical protein [Streptomyces avidinii]GGZ08249.1 hypothetical protein GCM10010343_38060 [Streptomyces avidinii]
MIRERGSPDRRGRRCGRGGGLRREDIGRRLNNDGHHRVVLATLRTAEEALLTGEDDARGAPKQAADLLHQAHRIYLPRLFSAAETDRARLRVWDPRIERALTLGSEYGLPEYLAAGPELLRLWQNAWSPNPSAHAPGHPRAAALVTAAVEIRRAGHAASLLRTPVEAVHEHYLEKHGGERLRPESLDEAWAWATRPRRATTALLQQAGERVRVFDYLLDVTQRGSGGTRGRPGTAFFTPASPRRSPAARRTPPSGRNGDTGEPAATP